MPLVIRPLRLLGLCVFFLAGCLPNPQSVKERRDGFPRTDLRGAMILDAMPAEATTVGAVFGERIKLEGYRMVPSAPKKGDTVKITWYWSAQKPINEDYQIFVHGDAVTGTARRMHGDHFPAKGKYPTDVWMENEIIVDEFTMKISGDYGASKLAIYTGLYKGNYRVPLTGKGLVPKDNDNRTRAIEISF